jgi:FkbM family methyltransferase
MSGVIRRIAGSLFNASSNRFGYTLAYRAVTFLNLVKKGLLASGRPTSWTLWGFPDCIVHVRFKGVTFSHVCRKGKPYNIYLNPYFHEYDIGEFVCSTLRDGDTFIDVGAMAGLYTMMASKSVGDTGKVISIEPNPDCLSDLQANIQLNGLGNVALFRNALGERNAGGITMFYDEDRLENASILKDGQLQSFRTDMVTLDSIAGQEPSVRIVKIDTEGYDAKVIEGALSTLDRTQHVLVETDSEITRSLLVRAGFRCRTLRPSGYMLATRTGAPQPGDDPRPAEPA